MIRKTRIPKFLSLFLLFLLLAEMIPLKAQAIGFSRGSSVFTTIFLMGHNYKYYNRPYAFESQIISDLSKYNTHIVYLNNNNLSFHQFPVPPSESFPDTSSITEINFIGTPSEVRAFSKDNLWKVRQLKKNIEWRKNQGRKIYLSEEDRDFLEDFDNLNFPEPNSENTVIVRVSPTRFSHIKGYTEYLVKQTYVVLLAPLSLTEAKTTTQVKYKDSENVDISVATHYQQEDYVQVYERPGRIRMIKEGEKIIYRKKYSGLVSIPYKPGRGLLEKHGGPLYGTSQLEKDGKTYYIEWIDDWAWNDPKWQPSFCKEAGLFCYNSYAFSPWIKKISVTNIQTTSEPITRALNSDIIYLRQPRCTHGSRTGWFKKRSWVRCDTEALSADGRVGHAVYEDSKKSWGGFFFEFALPAALFMVGAYYLGPYLAATNEVVQGTTATAVTTLTTSAIDIAPTAFTETVVQAAGGAITGYVTTVGASPIAIEFLTASGLATAVSFALSDPIVQMVSTPGGFGTVEDSNKLGVGNWTWTGGFESLPIVPPITQGTTYVIDPLSASRQVSQTQQFVGWYDPDGPSGSQAQQNKTSSASWISSNTSVATISSGLASCVSSGSVTITSVYSGITATASLNCLSPAEITCQRCSNVNKYAYAKWPSGPDEICDTADDNYGAVTYTCDCSCTAGSNTSWNPGCVASLTCTALPKVPQCTFTANPASILLPQSSTLSWSCQYADSCSIDQGIGSVSSVSGAKNVTPTQTTTYTLTCSGLDGSRSYQATVNVGFIPRIREIIPR